MPSGRRGWRLCCGSSWSELRSGCGLAAPVSVLFVSLAAVSFWGWERALDFVNLSADTEMWHPNCTSGRGGYALNKIVLHHNAGAYMSAGAVYSAFTSNGTSAHYNVDAVGNITQYVHDWDTAYHAGHWPTNQSSIGIEHANVGGPDSGWAISSETVEYGARLTAALCYNYGLGRPAYGVNVFPHNDFFATACPGQLDGSLRDTYMDRAGYWYDNMSGQGGEGWVQEGTGWWYRNEDGAWQTGWFQVKDSWYFADLKGWLQSGWLLSAGKWYFLHDVHDARFGQMETGWVQVNSAWFYLAPEENGAMVTGWRLIDGKWFYFESNGAMRTGWLEDNGHRFFLRENGAMAHSGVFQTRYDGGCSVFDSEGHLIVGRVTLLQDEAGMLTLAEAN